MEKSYKEYLTHITTFVFDVDGVLTDGTINVTTSGEMLRTMNIRMVLHLRPLLIRVIMFVSFRAGVMKACENV